MSDPNEEQVLIDVMVYSCIFTSSVIVVACVYALYSVQKGTRFELITMCLFGLLMSNLATIAYSSVYPKRHRLENEHRQNQTDPSTSALLPIVTASMSADLIKYLAWNSTMWLFAYKYWQISIEMPKAIKKRMQSQLSQDDTIFLIDSHEHITEQRY